MFKGDLPEDYRKLSYEEKKSILQWIDDHLQPAKKRWWMTSYSMKHTFEHDEGGFYISNGQFKGAMLEAGYKPVDPNEQNWTFRIRFKKRPTRFGAEGVF